MKPYRLHNGECLPRKKRKKKWPIRRWHGRVIGWGRCDRHSRSELYYFSRVSDPMDWSYSPTGDQP